MVTPTSTKTAIPQTAVSVRVKDYERYDNTGGRTEVEYYDKPNYKDSTGSPKTKYTWVDTRPANPRPTKQGRNSRGQFVSGVPEGYEGQIAEQEAKLQQYEAEIQAAQQSPRSQAELRTSQSAMAGYTQRQNEAQQFEQAKQEALAQVYSQEQDTQQARAELESFKQAERDAYNKGEALAREQELLYEKIERQAIGTDAKVRTLEPVETLQTFTAPQGEKYIFAKDGRTIVGVESTAFQQSLALPQYQKQVEEWNKKVAEQEAQTARNLSFFGKVTGQEVVSTAQGAELRQLPLIAGTNIYKPQPVKPIPTRTAMDITNLLSKTKFKYTPGLTVNQLAEKKVIPIIKQAGYTAAQTYVAIGKPIEAGIKSTVREYPSLLANVAGTGLQTAIGWKPQVMYSPELSETLGPSNPRGTAIYDTTKGIATFEKEKSPMFKTYPVQPVLEPISPSTYKTLAIGSGFLGLGAPVVAALFFTGNIEKKKREAEALKQKQLTWKDYTKAGVSAGIMGAGFGYGSYVAKTFGLGSKVTSPLINWGVQGVKTTAEGYFVSELAGEGYKIGSLAKQGYYKQAALPAVSLTAGIIGASAYPTYKYVTEDVYLKVGKTPKPKVIAGQILDTKTNKRGVTSALLKLKVEQEGIKYVTVKRYQTWFYQKPTTLATGQVVMQPKTISVFGKKIAPTDILTPKYEGDFIKYQIKYAPLTPKVIKTKTKYTNVFGSGIVNKVKPQVNYYIKNGKKITFKIGKPQYKTSIWLETQRQGAKQVLTSKVSGKPIIATEKNWDLLSTKEKTLVGKALQQQRVLEFGKGVVELKGKQIPNYLKSTGKQVSIIPEVKVQKAYKYQANKPPELIFSKKEPGIYIEAKGKNALINYQTQPELTINLKNIKPIPLKTIKTRMASITESKPIVLIEQPGKVTRGLYKGTSAVGKTSPTYIDERIIQLGKQGTTPFGRPTTKPVKVTGTKSSPEFIQTLYRDATKPTTPKYTQPKVFKGNEGALIFDDTTPASDYAFGKSKYVRGADIDSVNAIIDVGTAGSVTLSPKATPLPQTITTTPQLFVYSPKIDIKPVTQLKPVEKLISIQKAMQIVKPLVKTEVTTKPIIKTATAPAIRTLQSTLPVIKPITKPIVKPLIKPVPMTPPVTPVPKTPTTPTPTPFTFGFEKPKPTKQTKVKSVGGVIPYGRRRGKYIALGGPTTVERAKAKAKQFLLTTLGASAQVRTLKGEKLKIAEENELFRPGSKGRDLFTLVQRRSKRLKSRFETSEIVGIRRGVFFK